MTSPNPQEGGKHTPGPWRTDGCYISSNYGEVGHAYWVSSMPADMSEANARLIAAAPALLEALKLARAFAEAEVENREHAGGTMSDYINEAQEVVDAIDAAISQAEASKKEEGR